MDTVYCDIVPHSRGWLCLMEGQPPRGYNSFWLALAAARQSARHPHDGKRVIIRRQDLSGMLDSIGEDQHNFPGAKP